MILLGALLSIRLLMSSMVGRMGNLDGVLTGRLFPTRFYIMKLSISSELVYCSTIL